MIFLRKRGQRLGCFEVSTPPTRGAGQREKKLGLGHALWVEERCLASGGKLYTESPMVSTGGSPPPVNPWVSGSPAHQPPLVPSATSVVPSPVCKPLVTAGDASASAAIAQSAAEPGAVGDRLTGAPASAIRTRCVCGAAERVRFTRK